MNISEIDLATLAWKPNVMADDLCPFCKSSGRMEFADIEDIQVERCGCGRSWVWTDEAEQQE